jgi:hypothetical protein
MLEQGVKIMIPTISSELSHKMFKVLSRDDTNAIFRIRFGAIPTEMTIQLFRLDVGRFEMKTSHAIQTELQAKPYWVHHRVYDSPGDALRDFRSAFSQFYRAAERKGYEPKESWFVAKTRQ